MAAIIYLALIFRILYLKWMCWLAAIMPPWGWWFIAETCRRVFVYGWFM